MRRQFARCEGLPCARRGNQASGTVIVLPSAKSAISASSVAVTFVASTAPTSTPEILMPCLHKQRLVLFNHSLNSPQFGACESTAPLQADRLQPEFSHAFIPLHMNMDRLV